MKRNMSVGFFAALALMSLPVLAAIPTIAVLDPLLGPPILYDSGVPLLGGGFATPSLDPTVNGGLTISGIEVLGPGAVYVTTDDGLTGPFVDGTSIVTLNTSAGPGTNLPVAPPVPFTLNTRGYDLTLNPASGFLGIAGTPLAGAPAPMVPGAAGIYELDPAGAAAPIVFTAGLTGAPTTSGLTYTPGGPAVLSTDGIPAIGPAPAPLPGGIYSVPAGGAEALIALDAIPAPGGVGGAAPPSPGDDHVITLDGRTIFLNDGSNLMHDVTAGAGAVALLIDLTLVPAVAPFLSAGGVRGDVNPIDGDIFTGWGLGGPGAPPGGSALLRVDDFGAGAAVAVAGLDNVRDIAFGPSTFAATPTGVSLYITELEGFAPIGAPFSNIWEIGVIPEPSSSSLLLMASLLWAFRHGGRLA